MIHVIVQSHAYQFKFSHLLTSVATASPPVPTQNQLKGPPDRTELSPRTLKKDPREFTTLRNIPHSLI